MKKFIQKLKKGLTIEYAIVMMALVAAFVGVVLTTASAASNTAGDYRRYSERKSYIDRIGDAYIRKYCRGETYIDMAEFNKNDYNLHFSESNESLVVYWGSERSTVELMIRLGNDANGDGLPELFSYVYGVA